MEDADLRKILCDVYGSIQKLMVGMHELNVEVMAMRLTLAELQRDFEPVFDQHSADLQSSARAASTTARLSTIHQKAEALRNRKK